MGFLDRMNDKLWPMVEEEDEFDLRDGADMNAVETVPSLGLSDDEKQAMEAKFWGV